MILEALLALCAGLIVGVCAGLIPGLHSNLVATLTLLLLPTVALQPTIIIIFLVTMTITHILVEFIPSIYLGATESDAFLATLPGHKLLLKGRGAEAVESTLQGALIGGGIVMLTIPFFLYVVPLIEESIKPVLPFLLIGLSLYLIMREEVKLPALLVFILAGILGYTTLNIPLKEPLLPLLSGLFGVSALVSSLTTSSTIPTQKSHQKKKLFSITQKATVAMKTLLIGPLCSLLPAIGGGYAALISSELSRKSDEKEFLAIVGAMSVLTTGASVFIVLSIDKARTGVAAALQTLSLTINPSTISVLIGSIIISTLLAYKIAQKLSYISIRLLAKTNYRKISVCVLLVLVGLTACISGVIGVVVLITGGALGVVASTANIKKTHLMGALIIPTILYYLI